MILLEFDETNTNGSYLVPIFKAGKHSFLIVPLVLWEDTRQLANCPGDVSRSKKIELMLCSLCINKTAFWG